MWNAGLHEKRDLGFFCLLFLSWYLESFLLDSGTSVNIYRIKKKKAVGYGFIGAWSPMTFTQGEKFIDALHGGLSSPSFEE